MGRKLSTALLLVAAMTGLRAIPAAGQEKGFGLGIFVGEPTGITAKLWLSDIHALDIGMGWSVGGFNLDRYDPGDPRYDKNASRFHVHADFLWHNFDLIEANDHLPVFYGFGARMNTGAGYNNSFGLRGAAGLAWLGDKASLPIDIFVEVNPVLQFNPSTRFGINGGIGARYFFF